MIKLSRAEKEKLQALFPEESFVHTMKKHGGGRGSYYCIEKPSLKNALKHIRRENLIMTRTSNQTARKH